MFKSTGLHVLPEKPYLGASADGKLLYTHLQAHAVLVALKTCPYSIDGNLTISQTSYEISDKYGKKFFM